MSNNEKKALAILQESKNFLQKELTPNDEIIKTLTETQISILESVSEIKK